MTARIVVGVDKSDASKIALDVAVKQARMHEATLEVVHAWMPTIVERQEEDEAQHVAFMTDLVTHLPDDMNIDWRLEVGTSAEALLKAADGAHMLVVGTRGHGGFGELLLGSTSHQVVTHAPCPVLVVPTGAAA